MEAACDAKMRPLVSGVAGVASARGGFAQVLSNQNILEA